MTKQAVYSASYRVPFPRRRSNGHSHRTLANRARRRANPAQRRRNGSWVWRASRCSGRIRRPYHFASCAGGASAAADCRRPSWRSRLATQNAVGRSSVEFYNSFAIAPSAATATSTTASFAWSALRDSRNCSFVIQRNFPLLLDSCEAAASLPS